VTQLSIEYFAARIEELRRDWPLLLADGQALEGVSIPIFHGGSISGRVVDASGDPVEFAQVSLLRIPAAGRVGRPTMRGGTATDDRGEFRIGRLEPGSYIVQVIGRRGPNPEDMLPAGALTTPPLPLPLPTYYPGALSIDQAQPIVVDRGQAAADIEVVLSEGVPGVILGTLTANNGASSSDMNGYVNVRRVLSDMPRGMDGFLYLSRCAGPYTAGFPLPDGRLQLRRHQLSLSRRSRQHFHHDDLSR